MSDSGNDIVQTALAEVGKIDGTKYGADANEAWCSEFVSWVYWQSGYPFKGGPSSMKWHLSNVSKIKKWFTNNSTFISKGGPDWNSFKPTPGDYVCFGNNADKESHSGIVKKLDNNDTLHTIEGNAGGKVKEKTYPDFRNNTTFAKWVQGIGLRCGKQLAISDLTIAGSSAVEIKWRKKQTVTKVSLDFRNHAPSDYDIDLYTGGSVNNCAWINSKDQRNNTSRKRQHVWFKPEKSVFGMRIKFTKCSADDSLLRWDMSIQK